MYLLCENCKQVIARFEPGDIRLPLVGHMFDSVFPPERKMPGPFQPTCDWLFLRCPHCPIRPIFERNRLWVSDSVTGLDPFYLNIPILVVAPLPPIDDATVDSHAYACPDCGKEYTNKKRYVMYHTNCKARE